MTGITVLGPVTVGDEGSALPPRDRVVLSVLVAHRGSEVSADTIAEALWGEDLPASWHKVVQGCVARLRRRLGHEAIVTGRDGYRLAVPAEHIDAGRFERLVRRARELLALDHPDQAAYAADEALALWRGAPLGDLADWPQGRGEVERLEELRLRAEELRLDALLASGRHEELLSEATARVREQPLREHRWALVARAHYVAGRQADALATLRRARETLADELGLDPGSELVELEQAVLQQDPGLVVAAAATTRSTSPWPGLPAYDIEDADSFFGRDAELGECLARLRRHPLVAVVGPSGSGKSSLVRAGLAARLRDEGRAVRLVAPGPRPLDDLSAALDGLSPDAVLVVDQCEEVFAPIVPGAVRATFLHRLVERTSQGPVVLTLRADRLGELAAHPEVARLVEEGLYLLKGLDATGLREAVERPAHRAGLLLEEGLVDLLLRDVEGASGSLPLLAHALRETWERRQGSTLTVEGYRASGGIRGAVAQTAERVYEGASPGQRETIRELLLRMVQPGPGGDPVRTSVARDALELDPEHTAALEHLVRARLVTAEADRLEIAHEALARAWPRLQSWLAEDLDGERVRHHLAASAEAWEAMGRPPSELYRGARLAAAREWRDTGKHRLTAVETAFLEAAEAAHASRLARAEAEASRQRRHNRRLRQLVAGAVVLALVAATFGIVARVQWLRSQDNADLARSHQLAAAAVAVVEEDPSLGGALAVLAAKDDASSPQVRDALHRTLAADRVVGRVSMNHETERLWAVLHPDGGTVAMTAEHVYHPAVALEVHDARTGDLVWEWVRPEQPGYGSVVVAGAQFSPDGAVLAGGVLWHPRSQLGLGSSDADVRPPDGVLGVHVWDATSPEHPELQVLDVGPCGGWPVAVAGDTMLVRTLAARDGLAPAEEQRLLAECRWQDGVMATLLVNRTTGASRRVALADRENLVLTVGHALTDDGALAVVPDFDTWDAVLLDGETGDELGRLGNALAFDFDSTGSSLLTIDVGPLGNDKWRIASVPDLEVTQEYTGRSSWSNYGRFSADDRTVWTTGEEGALVQWDALTGFHLRSIPGVGGGAPTDAGPLLLVPRPETAGAVLLTTQPPGEGWSVPSCGGSSTALEVVGDLVVVDRDCAAGPDGGLETFTADGAPAAGWTGVSWEGMAVSPDGRLVVARPGEYPEGVELPRVFPLTVLDLRTGEQTLRLEGFCRVHPLATALDWAEAGSPEAEGCRTFPERPFVFEAGAVRWSPDGRWIAAAGLWGVAVWDARTGDLVTTLGHRGSAERARWSSPYDVAFTPDSRRLLITTTGRYVVALETGSWATLEARRLDVQTAGSAGIVGFDSAGMVVVVAPLYQLAGGATVLQLDPATLEVRQQWGGVAESSVQSAALSPDGRHLALATSEGTAGVWDLSRRARVDQANPRLGRLNGVRWLDDEHLVLLSARGDLTRVTINATELLDLARARLTRGLSLAECASYELTSCPSAAELQETDPVVPPELRETAYELSWTPDELAAALTSWAESGFGPLDDTTLARLEDRAALKAGTFRLELTDRDYRITRTETGEVWCAGAISVPESPGGRLRLGADTGEGCTDFHYAEVGWELDGDDLILPPEAFRGSDVDRVLWTSKPLVGTD